MTPSELMNLADDLDHNVRDAHALKPAKRTKR